MNSPVVLTPPVSVEPSRAKDGELETVLKMIARNRFLPVPPLEKNFVGDGDYLSIGTEFLGHFVRYGGLKPSGKVLDIGCGIGRMAVPLTQYLDPEAGVYAGFDPTSSGIEWCTRNIGVVYPNFRFVHLDIAHELYNPGGYIQGEEITIPFAKETFDFAIMTSVVTHLPAVEILPYFREVSRLLRSGGRLFLSAFIMENPEGPLAEDHDRRVEFVRSGDGPAWYANKDAPLAAVAFDDGFLDAALKTAGFEIALKRLGHWRGRAGGQHYQDFFVAVKTSRGEVA
jgi:SAM-dependent methyltransferase